MTSMLALVRTALNAKQVAPSYVSSAGPTLRQYQFVMRPATFDPFCHSLRVAAVRENGNEEVVLFEGKTVVTDARTWSFSRADLSCVPCTRFRLVHEFGKRSTDVVLVAAKTPPHEVLALLCEFHDAERRETLTLFAEPDREASSAVPGWSVVVKHE